MAKAARKPFQSGREIMETYIPGYVSPLRNGETSQSVEDSRASGVDLAGSLLEAFGTKLDSLSISKKPRRSN